MVSKDISFKSMTILESKFETYLNKRIWVPDWDLDHPQFKSSFDPNDSVVVLMGSFFERVFQNKYWPKTNEAFPLYCLSHNVKKVLINVFGFKAEEIGLISRYNLFSKSKNIQPFQLNSNTELFYSGRLSPQKNIEFLVLTFFHLQLNFSEHLKLTLVGDFDNQYHKDILGLNFVDYEKKIMTLIDSLPWCGIPPKIISGKSPENWKNEIPINGIYISTSTLLSEDFSVTAAEVDELGLAMILPRWGGFCDLYGSNILFYDSQIIENSHQSIPQISKQAKLFCDFLMSAKVDNSMISPISMNDEHPQIFMTSKRLEEITQQNLLKWGSPFQHLIDNNLSLFSKTNQGQDYFLEIKKYFS